MEHVNPKDIRFNPTLAKNIASDLLTNSFSKPRDPRSEEYKDGFHAAAFNTLLQVKYKDQLIKPSFSKGSCQLDAWFSGYEEGRTEARSFQINYADSF